MTIFKDEKKENVFSRRQLVSRTTALAAGLLILPGKTLRSDEIVSGKDGFLGNINDNGANTRNFLDDNFLLYNKTAEILYHEYARDLPIIDYHCHITPSEIATNKQFENLTQIWLAGDHYKMRAMRANGVNEKFITGDASDADKFLQWATTIPNTMRNPLYHWTHLELKRYFGINKLLNPSTAKEIYDEATAMLQTADFSTQNLIKNKNVKVVCTTDDPVDDLQHHKALVSQGYSVKVLPAWRPDKVMAIEKPAEFNQYLDRLSEVSEISIKKYQHLIEALKKRQEYFNSLGCRLSDHGIETFYAEEYTGTEINRIFENVRSGIKPNGTEVLKFKSALISQLAQMNHDYGWTQQFHLGALRNNNTKMFRQVGADKGYDSMGDFDIAKNMSRFFDQLELQNKLTKTIVYNINPRDNELIATMVGNYNDGIIPGKMQYGSSWWYLDQKDGIEKQINTLSNMGLLSRFVGMLTDSRSFLSYPRHEYFRRILCNLIGSDVEKGELPRDITLLGEMVVNISYYNANEYFKF